MFPLDKHYKNQSFATIGHSGLVSLLCDCNVLYYRRETETCCHQPVLPGLLHQRRHWGQQGRHVLTRQPHLDCQDDPGLHQISRLQQVIMDDGSSQQVIYSQATERQRDRQW